MIGSESDRSADSLRLAGQMLQEALAPMDQIRILVDTSWAYVQNAGSKYGDSVKYRGLPTAGQRLGELMAQLQHHLNDLVADEAAERSRTT